MDIVFTILSLVGFIALTAGTALFVAAEFSLTALERSTVDEAARGGDRRSRQVSTRAQDSFVPALRRSAGHHDHNPDHRLPGRAGPGTVHHTGHEGRRAQ